MPRSLSSRTQLGRIYSVLSDHRWHTLGDFEQRDQYTARNRIGELRKMGHYIESRPCRGSKVYEYRLWLRSKQIALSTGVSACT